MAERRFRVTGDVDIANSSDLERNLLALVNATTDDLLIDCEGLEFIDSTGIGMLMHTKRLLAMHGRGFRVVNLTGMPLRSFELVGLTEMFVISKSEQSSA
jgi:anti-sigma B factor antagonist